MPLSAGDKLGPYEINSLIGKGGMGEVYRAHDPRTGRDVAIKVSAARFNDRFDREVRAVAALNHPNICTLFDVGPNYLVMEFIEGEAPRGPLPLDEALRIARQIGAALEAAHEKGITHRDLKPANIKIKPDGTVKVLDFGLAKVGGTPTVHSDNSPTLSLSETEAGVILGTAAYMSPEQAKGKPVDKRADIWAFGVVLYEMVTGSRLFHGETMTETLAGVLKGEPEWSKVPASVQPLLRSCLQKDPKQRLHDIADAKLLLETVPHAVAAPPRSLGGRVFAGGFVVTLAALAVLAFVHFREQLPPTQLMRFTIPVPDKVSVGQAPGFSLSPDGRYLAFIGVDNGGLRVWIRAMDTLQARVLPDSDTRNGRAPFWSPDSRFVAFDAGGKLKRIDIAGGPAQTICDLPGPAIGGSWNRDGVIVFGSNRGLMRVPAGGGTQSPVSVLDASRGETAHTYPFFLPDGKHFLYARVSGPGTGGIFAGTLDAKPGEQNIKQLFGTGFGPVYVPSADGRSGQVLFVRQGVLLAQAFDPQRLEPSGDPAPVADEVATSGGYSLFSASANGHLVYRTGQSQDLQLTWFDRQGRMTGTVGEPGRYNFLALSPDGTRAVVNRVDAQTGNSDLWLTELSQASSSRLTFDPATGIRGAAWSPDSKQIVFLAFRDGGNSLYQKATNGAGSEELLIKGPGVQVNQWSHDGKFLIFGISDPQTRNDLAILPMSGDRKPIQILRTQFDETGGRISPDGRWVAYRSNESGKNEIYVQPFNPTADSGTTAAEGKWMVSRGSLGMARWRDDSKELYYLAPDGKVLAVQVTANPAFHASAPEVLFQVPSVFLQGVAYPGTLGDVTGDGKRFLFALPIDVGTREEFTIVLNWQAALKK